MPFMRLFLSIIAIAGVAIALAGCEKSVHCTSWSGGDGHLLSSGTLTGCSDQKTRDVRCVRGKEEAPYSCTCVEGGVSGKTFQRPTPLPNSAENLSKLGNEQCGWSLK